MSPYYIQYLSIYYRDKRICRKPGLLIGTFEPSMRVICSDGTEVRIPKGCIKEMDQLKNPAVMEAGCYTLKCKARPQLLNALLDLMEDGDDSNIPDDEYLEFKSLCDELQIFRTFARYCIARKKRDPNFDPGLPTPQEVLQARAKEKCAPPPVKRVEEKPAPAPPARRVKEIPFFSSKPWDGIFAYLTRKFGENIHKKGVVHIMGDGSYQDSVVPWTRELDIEESVCYTSSHRHDREPWVCCDFNEWLMLGMPVLPGKRR